jgi:hypothetical protein
MVEEELDELSLGTEEMANAAVRWIQFECHVVFSEAFASPVLYFNAQRFGAWRRCPSICVDAAICYRARIAPAAAQFRVARLDSLTTTFCFCPSLRIRRLSTACSRWHAARAQRNHAGAA